MHVALVYVLLTTDMIVLVRVVNTVRFSVTNPQIHDTSVDCETL